jgi:hypothetical protein
MDFLDNGCLVPGVHFMTWNDFYDRFSFSPKRKELLEGLERAIDTLRQCGCTVIFIDGSFVTQKLDPNDYDACWEGEIRLVVPNMQVIEPLFLDFSNGRKSQKHKYKGEIFPAEIPADSLGTSYLDFFQQISFTNEKKGIVAIKL